MTVAACCSARSMNATRSARKRTTSASMAPRSHSRVSVATWSLRERAVCSRLPASPASSVSRISMFMCTSSSARFQANSPRSISPCICLRPRSMAARSAAERMPVAASMRACASDPAMSTAARRRSVSTDALKRCMRSDIGSPKRPDQARSGAAPASGLSRDVSLDIACLAAGVFPTIAGRRSSVHAACSGGFAGQLRRQADSSRRCARL